MDDLTDRFKAAIEDITAPPADVGRVIGRGRRARAWRGVAAVGATCILAGATVFGAYTIGDFLENDRLISPADVPSQDQGPSGFMLFGEHGMEEPFVSVTPQGEAFSLCVGALPARTSSVDLIDEATNEPVVTWDSNFVDKQGKRFVCAQAIQADIESLAQEPDRYSLRAQVGSDTESFPLVTASTSGADPELTVTTTPGSPYYVEFKPDK